MCYPFTPNRSGLPPWFLVEDTAIATVGRALHQGLKFGSGSCIIQYSTATFFPVHRLGEGVTIDRDEQARAAFRKLGNDPFFSLGLDGAHIFFMIKHMRKSDATIMRQIKM